ncbi:MAG: hypothetical protein ABW223_10115 [Rariglobus sp.]
MPSIPAEKILSRVLFLSAMDGWSITITAGLCTVVSVLFGQWIGLLVGGLVTAAGVTELRGRRRLLRNDSSGMGYLIGSQLLILVTMWSYSISNLGTYNEAKILAQFTPEARRALGQYGLSVSDIQPVLKNAFFGLYFAVIAFTLLCQGGLALYYRRQKPAVTAALAARANPTPTSPLAPPPLPRT